ncbi:MAG: GNAT family N-acetyltransferase [Planctomycetes bacterium]|nr:GNAT family N-acetyltransferase [Planctomycetota bacterium]
MRSGEESTDDLDALARLRIDVFRAYPYLYDGSIEYERQYLAGYVRAPSSVIVAVWDGGAMVGASTAVAMTEAEPEFREPLIARDLDPSEIFYFGESVLLPGYRGLGVGHRFFDEREAAAARHGSRQTCFAAVVRDPGDPRRPADYRSLEPFWAKRGYARLPGATTTFRWKEVGADQETEQRMEFWMRTIEGEVDAR